MSQELAAGGMPPECCNIGATDGRGGQVQGMKSRRVGVTAGALALSCAVVGLTVTHAGSVLRDLAAPGSVAHRSVSHQPLAKGAGKRSPEPLRVVAVGGSIALGWHDTGWQNWRHGWDGGYLVDAFRWLSRTTGHPYDFIDKAIVGADVKMVTSRYPQWLRQYDPSLVVLSWGLLNDIHVGTPLPLFEAEIRREIRQALARHAVVFMVTPPVTEISQTAFRAPMRRFMADELAVARSFHSPDVYIFNVFAQMKHYLRVHHQSYWPYVSNSWHPNHRGHVLAGHILYWDIRRRLGLRPASFVNPPVKAGSSV